MKRTRKQTKRIKKADAILCADLHIRHDTPICRTDDYLEAQFNKLEFIFNLCKENDCSLLVAGDIGNKSQWKNWLLEKVMSLISKYNVEIIGIPGQHDLPEHRLEYWNKSGCGVLHESNSIFIIQEPRIFDDKFIITPFAYSKKITKPKSKKYINVAMSHQMVIENKQLWPDQKALKGHELLKKFPDYNLFLTGRQSQSVCC